MINRHVAQMSSLIESPWIFNNAFTEQGRLPASRSRAHFVIIAVDCFGISHANVKLLQVKPASRPKHTRRCASSIKNGTSASIVYCAHLAIFTGICNVICKKIEICSMFWYDAAYQAYPVLLCGRFTTPSVHTQHKEYPNTDAHC